MTVGTGPRPYPSAGCSIRTAHGFPDPVGTVARSCRPERLRLSPVPDPNATGAARDRRHGCPIRCRVRTRRRVVRSDLRTRRRGMLMYAYARHGGRLSEPVTVGAVVTANGGACCRDRPNLSPGHRRTVETGNGTRDAANGCPVALSAENGCRTRDRRRGCRTRRRLPRPNT